MDIEFYDEKWQRLATDISFTAGYERKVVRSYRQRIQAIMNAVDERDLYAHGSWRFKKLKGDRSHQRSMRLHGAHRLIMEIREARPKNAIVIIGIEDYH